MKLTLFTALISLTIATPVNRKATDKYPDAPPVEYATQPHLASATGTTQTSTTSVVESKQEGFASATETSTTSAVVASVVESKPDFASTTVNIVTSPPVAQPTVGVYNNEKRVYNNGKKYKCKRKQSSTPPIQTPSEGNVPAPYSRETQATPSVQVLATEIPVQNNVPIVPDRKQVPTPCDETSKHTGIEILPPTNQNQIPTPTPCDKSQIQTPTPCDRSTDQTQTPDQNEIPCDQSTKQNQIPDQNNSNQETINFPSFIQTCKSITPRFCFSTFIQSLLSSRTLPNLTVQDLVTAFTKSGIDSLSEKQTQDVFQAFSGKLSGEQSLFVMGRVLGDLKEKGVGVDEIVKDLSVATLN